MPRCAYCITGMTASLSSGPRPVQSYSGFMHILLPTISRLRDTCAAKMQLHSPEHGEAASGSSTLGDIQQSGPLFKIVYRRCQLLARDAPPPKRAGQISECSDGHEHCIGVTSLDSRRPRTLPWTANPELIELGCFTVVDQLVSRSPLGPHYGC